MWVPWAFGSNLHAGGLKDAAKSSSGFSRFGAGRGAAWGHEGAVGSSVCETNAFGQRRWNAGPC